MQKNKFSLIIGIFIFLVVFINFSSAQNFTFTGESTGVSLDADYIVLFSGEEGRINIEVKNNLDNEIENVIVKLNLENLPFIAVGSSERDIDEIDDDDSEDVFFRIKTSTDAIPGNYNIPYQILYKENSVLKTKTGSFGIRISAKTNLDFSVETQNNIINQQGRMSLRIINKGFGDIKFVSVEIYPNGYELFSDEKIYIGTIGSDEDDVASFDVLFKNANPGFSARITYRDFENNEQTEVMNIPFKVYTREAAIELGLIQENNTGIYIAAAIALIFAWIIWRRIKKKRKNNKNRR